MAHVSIGQVAKAIESLQRFHAFFGVTFLSMKKTGVRLTTPTVWGAQQEEAVLNSRYARLVRRLGSPSSFRSEDRTLKPASGKTQVLGRHAAAGEDHR